MADRTDNKLPLADDGFARYYAEKLWEWIPPIYRHEDGLEENPNQHALRAVVEILASQAAISRRSIDRLWEDQFIDLCDDWAVAYLADLVGTRLLSNLNREGWRVDVAMTMFYRRRKGTPVVMEKLIQDITRWEGVVVESFRRLGRTRHRLDPAPGPLTGPVTGTPPGGTARLNVARGSDVLDGPFDDYAHTPDFRRHRGLRGRYNIPKLNFHLYRLRAFEVELATPVELSAGRFTFDPSGRDAPLFAPDQRAALDWAPLEEWQLPAPIPCRLLNREVSRFTPDAFATVVAATLDSAPPFAPDATLGGNLEDWFVETVDALIEIIVDPVRGRFVLRNDPVGKKVYVPRYHYGFAGEIGAGSFSRPLPRDLNPRTVFDTGGDDPGPVGGFDMPSDAIHEFANSKTYIPNAPGAGAIDGIKDLQLWGADGKRPYLTLSPDTWVFRAHAEGAKQLVLDGLWIGFTQAAPALADGVPVRRVLALEGRFEKVVIRHCTLDPGGQRADGTVIPYVELEIRGQVDELIIDSSITGPIYESTAVDDPCSVGKITICDSIVHGLDESRAAIVTRIGEVHLNRVTVFGDIEANRFHASEALIQGGAKIIDNQHSCIRFSAADSFTAQHYESHVFPAGVPNHFFTSRRFGDPGYAQLSQSVPESISRGAENRSEIGAFSTLLNPIKRDDLETKVLEYMPFGLIPQFIFET